MMAWLSMGGYWPYLWPSYALALGVALLNIYYARRSLREARREALRRAQVGSDGARAP